MHEDVRELEAPKVFLSYRREDTGALSGVMASSLRRDLGADRVFLDTEDIPGGASWRDEIEDALASSQARVLLIGSEWEGATCDRRRIDADDDYLRWEVERALETDVAERAIPVLIDLTDYPELPDSLEGLKDLQWIEARSDELADPVRSSAYQKVLVAVWTTLREAVPDAVLVVGGDGPNDRLSDVVSRMVAAVSDVATARELSRFASNATIVQSAELAARYDAVLVGDDEEDETLRRRAAALLGDPRNRSVLAVGTGAIALTSAVTGVAAASIVGAGAAAVPGTGSAVSGVASTAEIGSAFAGKSGLAAWWSGTGLATKAAVVAAAGLVAAVPVLPAGGEPITFESGSLAVEVDDDRAYPLGAPEEVEVDLGPPDEVARERWLTPDVPTIERSVELTLPFLDEPVELGEVLLPGEMTGELQDALGPGSTRVASAAAEVEVPGGLATYGYCYDVDDPTELRGGYRFDGGTGTATVDFLITMTPDGELEQSQTRVTVEAAQSPEWFVDVTDLDVSRCVDSSYLASGRLFWSS